MKLLKLSILALAFPFLSFTVKQGNPFIKSSLMHDEANSIQWKTEEIDLGEIAQSKPVSVNFEFKNTGDLPVIIESVQASCGCTATNYSKTPVLPGETTKITATYNAAAKGSFKKNITVTTNADKMPKILTIKGVVI